MSRLKQLIDKGGHLLFAYPNGGGGGGIGNLSCPTFFFQQFVQHSVVRASGGGRKEGV